MGSIESNLLKNSQGEYDLSEAHTEFSTQNSISGYNSSRLNFNRTLGSGSDTFVAAAYLLNNFGPVLETSMPLSLNC